MPIEENFLDGLYFFAKIADHSVLQPPVCSESNIRRFHMHTERETKRPSPSPEEQMQNEYNYVLAQQITKRLLEAGLITKDEFNKITAKNRESFSPLLGRIMPKLT